MKKMIFRSTWLLVALSPIIFMWLFIWFGLKVIPDGHWSMFPYIMTSAIVWVVSVGVSVVFIGAAIDLLADKKKAVKNENS